MSFCILVFWLPLLGKRSTGEICILYIYIYTNNYINAKNNNNDNNNDDENNNSNNNDNIDHNNNNYKNIIKSNNNIGD